MADEISRLHVVGCRPTVADWGGCMSAGCTAELVQWPLPRSYVGSIVVSAATVDHCFPLNPVAVVVCKVLFDFIILTHSSALTVVVWRSSSLPMPAE